jgi:hypothetical protein
MTKRPEKYTKGKPPGQNNQLQQSSSEAGAVSCAPSLAGARLSLSFLGYYWT